VTLILRLWFSLAAEWQPHRRKCRIFVAIRMGLSGSPDIVDTELEHFFGRGGSSVG